MYYTPPKTYTPHAYQRKASAFLAAREGALLLLDPGLGKTSITYRALTRMFKRGEAKRVLVIAPLRVCQNVWPDEGAKWADFNHLRVVVLHGPKKEKLLQQDADIYVINPEGLTWLLGAKPDRLGKLRIDTKRWAALGFDTLVVDEISKFKHTSSQRFKLLKQVLSTFRRRWGLTGSPASNGLEGLFGQTYVVDQGKTFGQYITQFRQQYFVPAGFGGFDYKLQPGAEERIYAALAPLALRMAAEDYLDLPEQVDHNIYVTLPDHARKAYREMEETLIARVKDQTVTAATAGVAVNKARQISSGGIYKDAEAYIEEDERPAKAEREWLAIHDAKTDALEELVEELQGQQILVTYEFQHDLARLRKRFGKNSAVIGGGTTERRTKEIVAKWNAGEIALLFGHPAAMGHGLNLQQSGCRHVCHYSPTWDYELYDQVNKRVLRQGNNVKRVFIHHIIAKDTVDEIVMYALRSKERGQRALFDALKRHAEGAAPQ